MTSTANMTSIGSIYQGMNENPNKNSAVKDIFTFPKMRRAALVVSGSYFSGCNYLEMFYFRNIFRHRNGLHGHQLQRS